MSLLVQAKEQVASFVIGYGDFIADNSTTWTGLELCDLYYEFSRKMKDSVGSSSNFTGMSEYLIFHTVRGLIGDSFSRCSIRERKGTKDDELIRKKFISRSRALILGHEIPFYKDGSGEASSVNKKSFCPDISIQKDGELTHIIEVKVFLRGKGITETYERFNQILSKYPRTKILLIMMISGSKHSHDKLLEMSRHTSISHMHLSDVRRPISEDILFFLNS